MRIRKLLVIVVSFAIVFSIMPLQVLADEISDSLKCRSLSEASYTVSENVITTWPGHANIEIVFTNTGDAPICNWNYTFDFIYNIENPYNCTVLEHEGDLYTVGNSGWNKDIGPGESVTIGFTASSNDGSDIEYMPSFYLLNNANNILPEGSVTVDYVEYSDWTSGSSGALILTNNTDSSIGNWTITFSANRPITDAYDVSFSVNDDGTYTISGSSYSDISAGGTYQIGIQCGEHDSTVPFEISNLTVSSSTLALDLNEDTNNNGVPDVSEIDYNGFITTPTPTVTDTPTVTEEPTPTTTDAPTDTPEPTPTEFVFTPDQDLDGDGLYTSEEEMYGTDPNNPDSDSDGVSDGNEVQMMYFPTEADSDYDGIIDGDEDYDGDGIINRDEESYGTCPYEDGNPKKSNEDIIIILYWSANDFCVEESNALKDNYQKLGYKCDKWGFNGYASFIEKWSYIGSYEPINSFIPIPAEVFESQNYGMYYYNVTDVILISHGITITDPDAPDFSLPGAYIALGFDECLFPDLSGEWDEIVRKNYNAYFIEDIGFSRRFDSLDMLVCNAATQMNPQILEKNLAETFICHFSSIKEVYAFDCECSVHTNDEGNLVWIGGLQDTFDYDAEQIPIYTLIASAKGDTLIDLLEQYYPQTYMLGIKGQVRYYRISGGYSLIPEDLYDGNQEIFYEWYVKKDGQNWIANNRFPTNAEENEFYDPVLR